MYDYGISGLQSFFDAGLTKPTKLHATINPKEEYLFYVGAIFNEAYGPARAGFVLKDKNFSIQSGASPRRLTRFQFPVDGLCLRTNMV